MVNLHDHDDASYVALLQEHDPASLKSFYTHYRGLLHTIAMSVVHNPLDAEEVLQDVFLHVWNRAETYSPEKGKIAGWMAMLTRRRAIDRLRQMSSYQRATERYEAEYLPENEVSSGDDPALTDLRSILRKQLDRLPPAQKQAVEMNFLKGMSQREIAAATHLPLGTVKTRIELGLRKLGNMLMTSQILRDFAPA